MASQVSSAALARHPYALWIITPHPALAVMLRSCVCLQGAGSQPRCRGRMPALMGLPFGVGPSGVVSSKHVPVAPPDVSQL